MTDLDLAQFDWSRSLAVLREPSLGPLLHCPGCSAQLGHGATVLVSGRCGHRVCGDCVKQTKVKQYFSILNSKRYRKIILYLTVNSAGVSSRGLRAGDPAPRLHGGPQHGRRGLQPRQHPRPAGEGAVRPRRAGRGCDTSEAVRQQGECSRNQNLGYSCNIFL